MTAHAYGKKQRLQRQATDFRVRAEIADGYLLHHSLSSLPPTQSTLGTEVT